MQGSDPWLGQIWKVYAVQGVDGPYLKPTEKEGTFTLTAVPDPAIGPTNFYTVDFVDGDMPACWRGLLLYPRGNLAFSPPSPLLRPWTPEGNAPWLAAGDAVRNGLSVAMSRLEGDLYPETYAKALTLVCVPNSTTTGTPLLVLKLVGATATSGGQALPRDTPGTGGQGDH
ncbi:MAG TPA: hypothetical protein VGV09_00825 [Steroidobacteraceae bacterium]|nr:hypothetical protein [Steroidobacteraceae bacterium]